MATKLDVLTQDREFVSTTLAFIRIVYQGLDVARSAAAEAGERESNQSHMINELLTDLRESIRQAGRVKESYEGEITRLQRAIIEEEQARGM
jgi:hypothetical protein